MNDDDLIDLLEYIVKNVELREVKHNGRKQAQIALRRKDGSYDVSFHDGKSYQAGSDIMADLAKAKRMIEIRRARQAKKVVPRISLLKKDSAS